MAVDQLIHADLTRVILGAFYDVYNQLGPGFLESVYEVALEIDLCGAGVSVRRQESTPVYFRDRCIGHFVADLIVEERVLIELKSVRSLIPAHEAQVINLLKASKLEVGLLLNFGPKPEFKRLVYSQLTRLAADQR